MTWSTVNKLHNCFKTHFILIEMFCSSSLENEVESDSDDDEPLEKSASREANKDIAIEDKTFPEVAFAVDKAILREVEEMEEKVFTASLQVKVNKLTMLKEIIP